MSRLTKVSIDSVLYDIGSKGINSYNTLSDLVNEKVSELYDGCIAWCNEDKKYYQWLSDNEIISQFGRWRELEFGSEFQVDDQTVDAGAEKYKGKVIQYVGVDDSTHGFKKGCFYESKLSNTINYVIATVTEDTAGVFYYLDENSEYVEVVLIGDGSNYDSTLTYYKRQDVEVYSWVYINSLKVETEFDINSDNAVANKLITAKFNEIEEYIDGELTDTLKQYTDEKINDVDEVAEDKVWSSSKTKDYIDTNFEDYTTSSIEILQEEFDALTNEEKEANNYHCIDTGRMYYKNILYGEKKTITLSSQAEYDQMKADGKIESDVDYVIEETEQNVNAVIGYVPIGVVFPYCATTPPVNYLICDGSLYEKTAYPELYAIIGNAFGGDDSTFAVPNLTDRFIQGGTNVGETKEAGLPNIEGSGGNGWNYGGFSNQWSGAIYRGGSVTDMGGNGSTVYTVKLDASLSNPIYGNSDTVQPPSVVLLYIIKCK